MPFVPWYGMEYIEATISVEVFKGVPFSIGRIGRPNWALLRVRKLVKQLRYSHINSIQRHTNSNYYTWNYNLPRTKKHPAISWVVPPPSNSHHQDYYIFNRESQPKPSFATVAGRGDNPSHSYFFGMPLWLEKEFWVLNLAMCGVGTRDPCTRIISASWI